VGCGWTGSGSQDSNMALQVTVKQGLS